MDSNWRKNALVFSGIVMAMVVTIMAFYLPSKDLFIGLATLWGREVVGALMNYYFGASHKRNTGIDTGTDDNVEK
jgi:hypothetical protein